MDEANPANARATNVNADVPTALDPAAYEDRFSKVTDITDNPYNADPTTRRDATRGWCETLELLSSEALAAAHTPASPGGTIPRASTGNSVWIPNADWETSRPSAASAFRAICLYSIVTRTSSRSYVSEFSSRSVVEIRFPRVVVSISSAQITFSVEVSTTVQWQPFHPS